MAWRLRIRKGLWVKEKVDARHPLFKIQAQSLQAHTDLATALTNTSIPPVSWTHPASPSEELMRQKRAEGHVAEPKLRKPNLSGPAGSGALPRTGDPPLVYRPGSIIESCRSRRPKSS
ncbi:hypothetical protein PtA15_3A328 [Puccinia triticina]|uniref:Uncharacterized protein n=1 Tax=Puccinia triticina TaxID=208348 RepID=A0ABY7CJI1_9BASI|nr:uncharacterized protein PtA15_3A328 [Puccinia triticina]WAQ82962.1 hypothetical protein PtA15_3A328 [Puccinia triticina]